MPQAQDRAIVIGIERYRDFPVDALPGAINDATAMALWLQQSAHVTLVTSNGRTTTNGKWVDFDVAEMRPSRSDVESNLASYLANGKARQARRLYIFMAGHGFKPDAESLALITAEAMGDSFVPNVHGPGWAAWFADQLYFDEIVLWMDCCATRSYQHQLGVPTLIKQAARQNGTAKLFTGFAAQSAKSTFEGPFGPNGETMGVFTAHLLRALNGAARDTSRAITTKSIIAYMRNSAGVVGDTQVSTTTATALFDPKFLHDDDMLFGESDAPVLVLGVALPDGEEVELFDGQLASLGKFRVKDGQIRVSLGVGLYKAASGGFSRQFEVGAGTVDYVDLQ